MNSMQERKQLELQMQSEGRLPPGQSLTQKFPVLHYGAVPEFDPQIWNFKVFGEVEEEHTWTWQDFLDLPRTQITMDIHCVTRWSKFDTRWEGVSVQALVDTGILQLKPTANFVIQHADYNYTTNLPLAVVMQKTFLLATHFDGQPLEPDHGFPLRGVIGHLPDHSDIFTPYFWKGAKWLRGLEFSSQDRPGFWEKAGYHNDGDAWKEERFR
jgi:DMSO/TMAO reductase YedYZ molybdopterin-dependent catalytic subunit